MFGFKFDLQDLQPPLIEGICNGLGEQPNLPDKLD